MTRARLDKRVQFRRAEKVDDGFQGKSSWSDYGAKVWAAQESLGGSERLLSGGVSAMQATVWVVHHNTFTGGLTVKDALQFGGVDHQILSINERGRSQYLEITTGAEVSGGNG